MTANDIVQSSRDWLSSPRGRRPSLRVFSFPRPREPQRGSSRSSGWLRRAFSIQDGADGPTAATQVPLVTRLRQYRSARYHRQHLGARWNQQCRRRYSSRLATRSAPRPGAAARQWSGRHPICIDRPTSGTSSRQTGAPSMRATPISAAPTLSHCAPRPAMARRISSWPSAKDGRAYVLDHHNLGGIGGSLVAQAVSSAPIRTAPASYAIGGDAYVAFQGPGARCPPTAQHNELTVLKIGAPPRLTTAWCGRPCAVPARRSSQRRTDIPIRSSPSDPDPVESRLFSLRARERLRSIAKISACVDGAAGRTRRLRARRSCGGRERDHRR